MARSAPVDRAAGSPGAPGRPGTILRMLVAGTTWSGRADPQEASSDRHRSLADRQPPRTGADDEAEMGAFHDLFQPQRESNIRLRLREYLRFGLEAGVFYET